MLQTTPGFIVDGNVVRNVFSGGPAERAGLKKGDVIRAINNLPTASDSSLLVKYLAAVPDGSAVFLTWVNKNQEIVRANIETVEIDRFQDITYAYLNILKLEDAAVSLVASVDEILREEASGKLRSDAEQQELINKLVQSRQTLKNGTGNLEGDIVSILARQRAAEEEVRMALHNTCSSQTTVSGQQILDVLRSATATQSTVFVLICCKRNFCFQDM